MNGSNGHGSVRFGRRTFVSLLGAGAGTLALSGSGTASTAETASDDSLEALSFYSTASQVDADGEPLTDPEHVVALASEDAYVMTASEETDEADVTFYDEERIPLVSQDGSVMGIGSAGFVSDERGGFSEGNEQFLLNAWDDLLGGDGTVLWDESHGQYWSLERHSVFREYADANGYDLRALTEFDDGGEPELEFYSTASQVAPDGGALTDDETVLVSAEGTAENVDGNDDGAYLYADDERIPLVSRDGSVIGFGAPLVDDDNTHDENDAFVRSLWDEVIDGDTVYWDESHGQYYGSWQFADFIADAEADGYDVSGTDDLLDALEDDADAVVITTPEQPFTGEELEALASFVDDGGVVFFHDQSEFGGHDETANLNEIADSLDLAFRFNADQVEDTETGWADHVLTTTDFDASRVEGGDPELGLADADGLVITTPARPFWGEELEILESFVDDGGAVFLFDQSDFGGNDRTENLNEIADTLDLAFRFNGGQVEDEVQNDGPEYVPVSREFSDAFDYFDDREGIGIEFEAGETYHGRVVRVFDGDTFEVEFDSEFGYRETIRHIGIDTAETPPAENDPEEWFGIPDDADDHLYDWGAEATEFSLDLMAPDDAEAGEGDIDGRHVELTFDTDEPLRGNYGRLLMYMHYDPDDFAADFETGDFSVNYNRQMVEEGYARIYSSGFSKHDEWAEFEEAALEAGRGIWSAADFDALEEIRNDPVEELFVPSARSVRSARGRDGGRLADDRVPVRAVDTATQELGDGGVAYEDEGAPLVAVDETKRLALVGGLAIHERYEEAEGFDADTSEYGNFPFLANLIEHLSEADGDVLIAGGQGQFDIPGSITLERCQYFLRYLEGVGLRLRQSNDLASTLPAEDETPRAILVTAPAREFDLEEILALRRYRNRGGAVVLLGSAETPAAQVDDLNDLAWRLNTDLRFNDDELRDETNNVGDDPAVLETDALEASFPLFDAYEPETDGDDHPGRGQPSPPGRARGRD
ncbi:thermonuclease family protein [Natronococcus sp.]|uniref:thermonuclease family protein n=1 Tax=Natronococcus sp. TaxID=35747 RepID=UPI003A4D5875